MNNELPKTKIEEIHFQEEQKELKKKYKKHQKNNIWHQEKNKIKQ